ncbi:hypothetical protein SAMN05192533_110158 [Mesobacillus persicus]|uniref:Uncharacterized protein n=1 Tax=Mesobacillus persicus TaxID=930146 RepID=A0A1H8EZ73_9BACI|nr:hypothetical protein [Mesobacillus persicus]SEN24690.1 hypothetical protein SAMN05192533_110158 [Mesobacillus persicus]
MGYYNDDVAGLFTGDDKRRRGDVAGAFDRPRKRRTTGDVAGAFDRPRKRRTTGDVAGAFDRPRKRRTTGDVAGTFDRPRRKDDDVLGAFDENFKVPVKAFIDSEDICRAVRRCLINDLVDAAQDDDDKDKRKKRRRR